jgi:hypothetical protein
MSDKCLNCDKVVESNFCTACGQKKSTHRYSIQHFVMHDLVHGVFHFDKGFFYTAKQLFTRPGHSIREFIEGKRVFHYNYFSFFVILAIIDIYLVKFSSIKASDLNVDIVASAGYKKFANEYFKVLMIAGVPFCALASFLIFIKSKLNFTEHLVISMYRLNAIMIFNSIYFLTSAFNNAKALLFVGYCLGPSELIYTTWFLYELFGVYGYRKWVLFLICFFSSFLLFFINRLFIKEIAGYIGRHYLL